MTDGLCQAATAKPVGTHCAAGGARVDAGVDTNGYGVLDASEITSSQVRLQAPTRKARRMGRGGGR